MLNHEVAVEAIYEAREVLADVEYGVSPVFASDKAFELLLLSLELEGDEKAAVYAAAKALDEVANHPEFVDSKKVLAAAIEVVNHLLEKAAKIAAEAWVFAPVDDEVEESVEENENENENENESKSENKVESFRELMAGDWDDENENGDENDDENENENGDENENENENESLYDLLASIDDDDDDFDFDEDDGCGDEDVEYEYNNAVAAIKEKLESLENELFEYEFGGRKNDDDAYEQAYQLKANIRYTRQKQAEIEDLLESYKAGEIDAWTAQDRIYKKFSLVD